MKTFGHKYKRKSVVREKAEAVVDSYLCSYDLCQLVEDVSNASSWYGRFGRGNRELFIDALKDELRRRL